MSNVVYSGPQTKALISKETTFGTAVAGSKGIGFVQSLNMTERSNVQRSNSIGSRSTQSIIAAMYDAEGSIETDLQTGTLLAYAMGTDNPVNTSSDYTHTIATADTLSSFTLTVSHDSSADIVRTYSGCLVKSFRVSGDLGSPLKASFDIQAKRISTDTTSAGAYTNTTDQVLAPQFGTLSLYGATVAQVQSLEFSMDNQITYAHAIGHREATAPVLGVRNIDLRATFNFEDAEGIAQYKNFLADTDTLPATSVTTDSLDVASGAAVITYTNGITLGSGMRKWLINLAALKITDYAINTPVDGPVTADISAVVKSYDTTAMQYVDSYSANYIV